ncbi:MAG: putative DNA binding domain-containing protein [Clostridium sp.]|nr:putative DNA binding domain-containing protein [Clostridium sp.]
MNIKKLMTLLQKDEGTKLDYKLFLDLNSESGKKEFAKDVCAIANSKGGRGYLIVGVKDKTKEIVGLDDDKIFAEERVQQIISSRCEPPIPIQVDILKYNNKKIEVITVFDGYQKPYQIRETGAFHIRRGSTTDVMRKYEVLKAFEENLDLSIETFPIMKSNKNFLNMDLINKYFTKKGIFINKENEEFLLESVGITFREKESNKIKCTYGGLIVFSEINSLCISNNVIKIINKLNENTDTVNVIQGSLLTMIYSADEIIKKVLPKDYPVDAVLEAIKNAVLYREYTEMNRVIEVIITDKSVVVESPGDRIESNNKAQNDRYIKRNMWIYEKLITLDDAHLFVNDGRGFNRMIKSFKGKGRVKFVNSRIDNSFKVILPGVVHFK